MKQMTIFLLAAVCFFMLAMTVESANEQSPSGTNNQHVGSHQHGTGSNTVGRNQQGKSASGSHHHGTNHHTHGGTTNS